MNPPPAILEAFALDGATVQPVLTGLIHRTFRLDHPQAGRFALQSVSSIFVPEVHEDIEAVTSHLAARGVSTPRLRRTVSGALFLRREQEIWRVLDWIDGETIEKIGAPREAEAAARLLAEFHRALGDLEHTFRGRRLGVHDTPKHLAALEGAVARHTAHRLVADVSALTEEIFARTRSLPDFTALPIRVVHGDPKVSNVIFEPGRARGRALVDLDTVAPMALPLELGDALRSWCNPAGEDAARVRFDLDIFGAAIGGYASAAKGFVEPAEIAAILPATGTIMLELSSRFAADALEERYFGWDPQRFASRGEHNLLRARGQLELAKDFFARRDEAATILAQAFG